MYAKESSDVWYRDESSYGFRVLAQVACADQKWITLSKYTPKPMMTPRTNKNRRSAVWKYVKPNRSVKIGPSTRVKTPMKVRIVKTIPMMLLLRFQRYSHSAARIF